MKQIASFEELQRELKQFKKYYLLLYKKGTENSDCAYNGLLKANYNSDNIAVADVNEVRDIHTIYQITSAPTLLEFHEAKLINAHKGCHTEQFYTTLFSEASFTSIKKGEGEAQQKRVTVYSTPTCSWCTTLKNHLNKHGIKYSDIDVSKDQQKAEEMTRRSGQRGVPQTDIGGQMIVGFDKTKINTLLNINE